MEYQRNIVTSIAGLDPSGGAGILADIKTFEQHHCLGFGVASALTAQTEDQFFDLKWLSFQQILVQTEPLIKHYHPAVLKIGMIENLNVMNKLITWLKNCSPALKIIWDPVLSASSGCTFISEIDKNLLYHILSNIYLLTPNTNEAQSLSALENEQQAAKKLSQYCNVLLKGGHSPNHKGTDLLFSADKILSLNASTDNLPQKHGSGCILSSAIAANVANGLRLEEACFKAKRYTEKILNSNHHLLAYHA